MKTKSLKIPAVILAIGLVLALVSCLLTGIVTKPTITEHDFRYTVTYKLNGETKTFEAVYKCRFNGHVSEADPRDRYYVGEHTTDEGITFTQSCPIARKNGIELYIVITFNECYLMGDKRDTDYEPELDAPCLEAIDENGLQYDETELPSGFDAEIVSWEYPEPIENTFEFVRFSLLHIGSMFAMLVVGLLTVAACLIFVKRDGTAPLEALDKLSVLLNYVVTVAAIPFITVAVTLLQLTISGEDFTYQVFLCIPAFTAFTVAASIALRRKGFTKAGLFVQLLGPGLFFLYIFLESVIYNLFM